MTSIEDGGAAAMRSRAATGPSPEPASALNTALNPALNAAPNTASATTSPQRVLVSRAVMAATAAATIAAAPLAALVFTPAGGAVRQYSTPVYLLAQARHDIVHNDWVFRGTLASRIAWLCTYGVLAALWLAVALWVRGRERRAPRAGGAGDRTPHGARAWPRLLAAGWGTLALTGLLTCAAALLTELGSMAAATLFLRATGLCSPWWCCVAVLGYTAIRERERAAGGAALGYGAALAVLLLVPLPGPAFIKALVLAAGAAGPALGTAPPPPTGPVTPGAASSG